MADATLSGHEHDRPGFFTRWFMSTNHKDIGILYLFTAGLVGLISVAFTVYMRMELMEPGVQYMYLAFESSPAALESLFGRVGEALAAAGGGTNAFADQLSSLQATLMGAVSGSGEDARLVVDGALRADVIQTLDAMAASANPGEASALLGLKDQLDGQPDGHLWNVLITGHGVLMMFFVVIPALFGGLRQLLHAADDRRAGHGVPAPEQPQLLDVCGRYVARVLRGLHRRRRGSGLDLLPAAQRGRTRRPAAPWISRSSPSTSRAPRRSSARSTSSRPS
jgi:hypothetical protein